MPSERSRPSAMTGLNAARTNAKSISLQTCCNPFWMTARLTGSSLLISCIPSDLDEHITARIDVGTVLRLNDRGGIELFDNGGTNEAIIARQFLALIYRRFDPVAVEPRRPRIGARCCAAASARIDGLNRHWRAFSDHGGMQVHQYRAEFRQLDLEALPVCLGEKRTKLVDRNVHRRQADAEKMALPLKLHVGLVMDHDRRFADAFALDKGAALGDLFFKHRANGA